MAVGRDPEASWSHPREVFIYRRIRKDMEKFIRDMGE